MEQGYDLIVVGAGPGGYVAAIRASQLGMKTAVVERENLGGICLNWGCIPTKALLKSAEVAEYFKHAGDYGFELSGVGMQFDKIVSRSRGAADKMSKGVQFLFRKNNITAVFGHARLTAINRVEVQLNGGGTSTLTAPHIIVATGARARNLPGLEIDGKYIIGYREAMVLPQRPKSMLIMGSGAIGTEFAYFYNALGTKVTIIEYMDRILPSEDEEVSKQLMRIYKKNGIEILTNAKVSGLEKKPSGVRVAVETDGRVEYHEADLLLSAVGIVANVENLGLENLGVAMEKGKIKVDEYLRTNVPGVYAIGDCTPGPALAHKASAEAIVCVEKIAGHHPQPVDHSNIPGCVYCQPEVASVGMTEKAALDAGYELKIGKFPFTASGKATAAGKTEGFVKLIFDAKYGELLGAHMLGSNVTEMIAELVVARKLETTGHEIVKSVHPHPTLSEAVMEAAAAAYGEVIHL